MNKYCLEFILKIPPSSLEALKNSIIGLGEGLDISGVSQQEDNILDKDFKIYMNTEDPEIIFDTCAQFGKLKSVKVKENPRFP